MAADISTNMTSVPASTSKTPGTLVSSSTVPSTATERVEGAEFVSTLENLLSSSDGKENIEQIDITDAAVANGETPVLMPDALLTPVPLVAQMIAEVTASNTAEYVEQANAPLQSQIAMTHLNLKNMSAINRGEANMPALGLERPQLLDLASASGNSTNIALAAASDKEIVALPANANIQQDVNAAAITSLFNGGDAGVADAASELQLKECVGTPAWQDEVGTKLTWMIDRGMQSGSLRLSPEHLGPLEVRISIRNDQVSVWFGAAHAETRAALEHALPQLRELFAASGLSLSDAGVFREPPKESFRDPSKLYADNHGRGAETQISETTTYLRNGLFDAYA